MVLFFVFLFSVAFFSASVRGVRRRRVEEWDGAWFRAGALLFVVFFRFLFLLTALVLLLLRLLRLSLLLHYTVLHYNCFSFVTRLVRHIGDCRRLSCYYGWGVFLLCLAGLVALFLGTRLGLGDCYSTASEQ